VRFSPHTAKSERFQVLHGLSWERASHTAKSSRSFQLVGIGDVCVGCMGFGEGGIEIHSGGSQGVKISPGDGNSLPPHRGKLYPHVDPVLGTRRACEDSLSFGRASSRMPSLLPSLPSINRIDASVKSYGGDTYGPRRKANTSKDWEGKRGGGVRRERRQKSVDLDKGVERFDEFVVVGRMVSRTATTDKALDASTTKHARSRATETTTAATPKQGTRR
jgi:hypothetical protein